MVVGVKDLKNLKYNLIHYGKKENSQVKYFEVLAYCKALFLTGC
jgi:hypothetical protein